MFLKNRNIIFKMKISKVTDYAALTAYHSVIYEYRSAGCFFSRLCSLMREGRVDTKKPLFPKFSRGRTPPPALLNILDIIRKHYRLLFFKLDLKALCTGGYKLNPFALPHRVVARARRLELRRTVKVQPMALHDSL